MSFKYCQFVVVACCMIALLIVDVTSSPVGRERRSDDAGPLELVVEKLTQQVNSLNTQLIEQANSFTAQLDSVNAEVTALKAKTATLETTVAFHALNDGNDVQTAAYRTIILSHVATNIGNAYDPMTGVFTVPVSGLYDFQASILSAHVGTGQHAYAAIYVDSDRAALAISDTGFGPWNQATMKSIIHVNAGQKVYLKNVENAVKEYKGGPYNSFSGFLISAD